MSTSVGSLIVPATVPGTQFQWGMGDAWHVLAYVRNVQPHGPKYAQATREQMDRNDIFGYAVVAVPGGTGGTVLALGVDAHFGIYSHLVDAIDEAIRRKAEQIAGIKCIMPDAMRDVIFGQPLVTGESPRWICAACGGETRADRRPALCAWCLGWFVQYPFDVAADLRLLLHSFDGFVVSELYMVSGWKIVTETILLSDLLLQLGGMARDIENRWRLTGGGYGTAVLDHCARVMHTRAGVCAQLLARCRGGTPPLGIPQRVEALPAAGGVFLGVPVDEELRVEKFAEEIRRVVSALRAAEISLAEVEQLPSCLPGLTSRLCAWRPAMRVIAQQIARVGELS